MATDYYNALKIFWNGYSTPRCGVECFTETCRDDYYWKLAGESDWLWTNLDGTSWVFGSGPRPKYHLKLRLRLFGLTVGALQGLAYYLTP